nr:MAG TPA: hypothetical protein [Caudoviricetes sp.]
MHPVLDSIFLRSNLLLQLMGYIRKYSFFKFDRKSLNTLKRYSNSVYAPLTLIS